MLSKCAILVTFMSEREGKVEKNLYIMLKKVEEQLVFVGERLEDWTRSNMHVPVPCKPYARGIVMRPVHP